MFKILQVRNICLLIYMTLIFNISAYSSIKNIAESYKKDGAKKTLSYFETHLDKDITNYLKSKLMLGKDPKYGFESIISFLEAEKSWPEKRSLQLSAESILNEKTNISKIYKWFSSHKPLTSKGYYYHYKSALKFEKNKNRLIDIARDAWVNYHDFSLDETKILLKKFSANLDQNAHVRKIDNLLWNKEISKAKNLMPLVDSNYKIIYKAWINIINHNHKKEEIIFHNVRGQYRYHSGLLHEYLKLHIQNPPNEELISLFKHSPIDIERSKEWWKIRYYFARELFAEKKYYDAYIIVSKHGLTDAVDIAEAEWFAGWIALRFLKDPARASNHFEKLYYISKSSYSKSRGAYWLARCYDKIGKKDASVNWYNIAGSFGFTFYGQLAQSEMGFKKIHINKKTSYTKSDLSHFKSNKFAKISSFLAMSGDYRNLKIYAQKAMDTAKSDGEIFLIVDNLAKYLPKPQALTIAKLALGKNVYVEKYAYPTDISCPKLPVSKSFVFAIIRQESLFDQYAVSSANAKGLMQVIPDTAKATCKKLDIKYNQNDMLRNMSYNIKIGSNYVASLLDNFNDSYIMAIAGYNAGPHRSLKWRDEYGDPRKMKLYEVIDWIESIPFSETRNYVQRVVENAQVYDSILNKNSTLNIKKFIMNCKT